MYLNLQFICTKELAVVFYKDMIPHLCQGQLERSINLMYTLKRASSSQYRM